MENAKRAISTSCLPNSRHHIIVPLGPRWQGGEDTGSFSMALNSRHDEYTCS
jgi:hypothetical protein